MDSARPCHATLHVWSSHVNQFAAVHGVQPRTSTHQSPATCLFQWTFRRETDFLAAGPLATGTADTLRQSHDPARRLNEPYAQPSLRKFQPDPPVDLLDDIISINLNLAKERPEGHRHPPHPDGLRHRHQLATSSELPVAAQTYIPADVARAIGLGGPHLGSLSEMRCED